MFLSICGHRHTDYTDRRDTPDHFTPLRACTVQGNNSKHSTHSKLMASYEIIQELE